MADDLLQASAWKALQRHCQRPGGNPPRGSCSINPAALTPSPGSKATACSISPATGSRQDTVKLLIALAREREVPQRIQALFAGEVVNATENRPAQHMALRGPDSPRLLVNGTDIRAEIAAERERMLRPRRRRPFAVSSGARRARGSAMSSTSASAGSDLGLVMAIEALHEFRTPDVQIHYVSNVDGTQLADVLASRTGRRDAVHRLLQDLRHLGDAH